MLNAVTADIPAVRALHSYKELVAFFPPQHIIDSVSYENTLEIIRALIGFELTPDQSLYLETLSDLAHLYEVETAQPSAPASPLDALKFLMEQHEMKAKEIAALLEITPSIVHRILKGQRQLTAAHIARLAKQFNVSPATFLAVGPT